MCIFPEGSRTHDGKGGACNKTVGIRSVELCVPVLPVGSSGAFDAMPRGHALVNPCRISVRYLPVVQPSHEKDYGEQAEEIRTIIADGREG